MIWITSGPNLRSSMAIQKKISGISVSLRPTLCE